MHLPERILDALAGVSDDRAKAIVKCTEAVCGNGEGASKGVQLVEVAPGKALIVIGPCAALRQIAWLRLDRAPARYLLVLPTGTPVERLEVAILDLIENLAPADAGERKVLEELRAVIGAQRRKKSVTKGRVGVRRSP